MDRLNTDRSGAAVVEAAVAADAHVLMSTLHGSVQSFSSALQRVGRIQWRLFVDTVTSSSFTHLCSQTN